MGGSINSPTYLLGRELDCLTLEGESVALKYHCRACGAFGNYWIEQQFRGVSGLLCPACGEVKGERL